MPSPASPPRRMIPLAALLAAVLAPAPAAADHLITFTGAFDDSDYSSSRWDGADQFEDDLPPLFDLTRLGGGSFRATFRVPEVPPVDEYSGVANFEYHPPAPLALVLLDAAGGVVHRLGGGLYELDVENFRRQGRPGSPPQRANDVSFYAVPDGLAGLDAPPELYGPNRLAFGEIAATFADGSRPLGDVSIPLDGATYLDFDGRELRVYLAVANGDPSGDGPNLYVYTQLVYQITGASVAPAAVPEPSGAGLMSAGAAGLAWYARRRRGRAARARTEASVVDRPARPMHPPTDPAGGRTMNPPASSLLRLGLAIAAIALASSLSPPARAALILEPVFNRVAGFGGADDNFPLYDPGYLIGGVAYFTADEPGEIVTYASGDPRDPFLDEFHVWNNTGYAITGFTLRLIGTAAVTDDPGAVVRGPVDAIWGDADGDGLVGSSDIFSSITVSADGKEIRFEGGLIPVGGRFTDVHLAVSDAPPDFAGIDSSFTGVRTVPEPSGSMLSAMGLVASALGGVWRGRAARAGTRRT
ncbi:PEP-CTERM sorting domain-containing protein [Paludisphaera mucosa]|uniref:PEP-CTERM sorting domain-containing protein n=1 Tax=Paludisphaera mucosa TaxID=3030827 RepID=A0ABT6FKP6_9BACT|nr:PEP-CTERM sorting domain-containing protein [Paludisphaera mucosa]MDG3008084.1 PEP-CTERM sorting domain-containing protein [Paludisphaera mucosa]